MASQKKKILSHENKRRLIINTIERLKTSQRSKDLKKKTAPYKYMKTILLFPSLQADIFLILIIRMKKLKEHS